MKDGVHKYNIILKSVKTEEFAFFEQHYTDGTLVGLMSQIQFKIDTTTKMLGSYFSFEFEQNKIIFLKIVVSCHFLISDKDWDIITTTEGLKVKIKKEVIVNFAKVGVDTSRGVLAAKTEAKSYPQFLIPEIDLNEFVKEDATFNIGEPPKERLV